MDLQEKTDADGNITVYKARLVKGFPEIQGVDYDETFSPVAKLKSVRILLAIPAFFDYEIWQMDVKTAFLNGDIEEELHMVQPKGQVLELATSTHARARSSHVNVVGAAAWAAVAVGLGPGRVCDGDTGEAELCASGGSSSSDPDTLHATRHGTAAPSPAPAPAPGARRQHPRDPAARPKAHSAGGPGSV
ncbi:hypothetical protein QYE76_030933 [Lolium multiflorum]|uniref:Reverse transcriptase Ty1/copia-type domain-containing protein n=1 Tax=Lolium multiflorum TaxID=4521 RepID=A0AAD8QQR6_LOLMU|nr:hypothetical protein QYE76_030933 [Lolium multiflorum]